MKVANGTRRDFGILELRLTVDKNYLPKCADNFHFYAILDFMKLHKNANLKKSHCDFVEFEKGGNGNALLFENPQNCKWLAIRFCNAKNGAYGNKLLFMAIGVKSNSQLKA